MLKHQLIKLEIVFLDKALCTQHLNSEPKCSSWRGLFPKPSRYSLDVNKYQFSSESFQFWLEFEFKEKWVGCITVDMAVKAIPWGDVSNSSRTKAFLLYRANSTRENWMSNQYFKIWLLDFRLFKPKSSESRGGFNVSNYNLLFSFLVHGWIDEHLQNPWIELHLWMLYICRCHNYHLKRIFFFHF